MSSKETNLKQQNKNEPKNPNFDKFTHSTEYTEKNSKTETSKQYSFSNKIPKDDSQKAQQQPLTLSFPLHNDYQPIPRSIQTSLKYQMTLKNKQIHILSEKHPIQSIKNRPIVCSYADMEFKLSPTIHKQWIRLLTGQQGRNIVLGYTGMNKKTKQVLIKRMRERVCGEIKEEWMISFSNMLGLYYSVVSQLTSTNDNVLIFTPTYYRFVYTLKEQKRQIIEYQLKTRVTGNGKEFYIDFDQLEEIFQKSKIKLVIWISPHNPSGRIWRYEEVQKLKNLIVKHKSLVFSDDIFCESVENYNQYTSLLRFQEVHPYLIWASSFGKAFNCSGNSYSYTFTPNEQLRTALNHSFNKLILMPMYSTFLLLQSCYTAGEEWRLNTSKYIKQNYNFLKSQSSKRGLNLNFYTLDSSYLSVVDFSFYPWTYSQIKSRLGRQNIFPTYLDACFVKKPAEEIKIIRLNLALNRQVVKELVDRFEKVVKYEGFNKENKTINNSE